MVRVGETSQVLVRLQPDIGLGLDGSEEGPEVRVGNMYQVSFEPKRHLFKSCRDTLMMVMLAFASSLMSC